MCSIETHFLSYKPFLRGFSFRISKEAILSFDSVLVTNNGICVLFLDT